MALVRPRPGLFARPRPGPPGGPPAAPAGAGAVPAGRGRAGPRGAALRAGAPGGARPPPGDDSSFSGGKTARVFAVRGRGDAERGARRSDLAASYQRAIVRALVERTRAAAKQIGAERVAIVGGVAANSELRQALPEARPAPLELCTDNAAMIASAARFLEPAGDALRLD